MCYFLSQRIYPSIFRLKGREWFRPLCPSIAIESVPNMFHGRLKETLGKSVAIALRRYKYARIYTQLVNCYLATDFIYLFSTGNNPDQQAISDKCCIQSSTGDPHNWVPASPYMSFAPYLTDEAKKMFPAIAHFDGTAR